MNKILQKIKSSINFKKRAIRIVFIGFLALVLSQAAFPIELLASGPKFNFMPGDYELLRGANATKGETNWHDPVTATSNDSVAVIVYYHNGVDNTIAKNTKIKVELPNPAVPSKSLKLNGHLWADNASEVVDNFTINSSQNVFAEYIPGTTQIFKDGSQTGVTLPDGITSANGINIGNIVGCWQYSGYVVFQVKIKAPGVPDLLIQKHVANSTTEPGTQNWVKQNSASPGDILAYKLYFLNPGTENAHGVIVKDVLPAHVTYLAGTTKLYTNQTGTSGQVLPDTITTSGIALGDVQPGGPNSGYVVFQVKVNPNLTIGQYTLINTAKIWAQNVTEKQDSATTLVNIQGQTDLGITKYVRNLTQNQPDWVKENSATNGNELEYKLAFTINGNEQAINVKLNDVLPNVSGVPVNYLNGSTKLRVNGTETIMADTITTSGVIIGNYSPGTQGFLVFKVKIGDNAAVGQYNLVNTGVISADNASQKQDTALTHLTITPPPMPYLKLEKFVRNVSQNEISFVKANSAAPGDTLEYLINFKNIGTAKATVVIVRDILPAKVSFISGSTIFHFNNKDRKMPDELNNGDMRVSDLEPGQSGSITFRVKVLDSAPNGTLLVNTVRISCKEGCYAQDTAQTIVNIVTPPQEIETPPTVLGAKALPPTGGMFLIVFIIASAIVGTYYYIKAKKELANELLRIRML